jgi:sugar phosphate isomerase/epimerase
MQLGIFAKTYGRTPLAAMFAAVRAGGLTCIQFNFTCAGLPTLPDSISAELADQIRGGLDRHGLQMAAVSGTCNLIHPDKTRRAHDLSKLQLLIRNCGRIGTRIVTLCTGSRDPADMWRAHPANQSPESWKDLSEGLERLLPVAEECQVLLGVEPEPANVIDSAPAARKLLDEMRSPALKIVMDAANIIAGHIEAQHERLATAFSLLSPDIVLAHAKDFLPGPPPRTVAAGHGALDYPKYLNLLQASGFDGALILHSLEENEVPDAVACLQRHLQELEPGE